MSVFIFFSGYRMHILTLGYCFWAQLSFSFWLEQQSPLDLPIFQPLGWGNTGTDRGTFTDRMKPAGHMFPIADLKQ